MGTTFGLLIIGISVRIQLYSHVVFVWKNLMTSLRPKKSTSAVQVGTSEVGAATVVEKISVNALDDDTKVKDGHGAEEMNPAALEMV